MADEKSSIEHDEEIIIKSGYLMKQSLHLKQFRKRWMVLKGNVLYSYKAKEDTTQPTEIIYLYYIKDINEEDSTRNCKPNQFKLVTHSDHIRLFQASSLKEAKQWIKY